MRVLRALILWSSLGIVLFTGFAIWSKNARGEEPIHRTACFSKEAAIELASAFLVGQPKYVFGCINLGTVYVGKGGKIIWGPRLNRAGSEVLVYNLGNYWAVVFHVPHGTVT